MSSDAGLRSALAVRAAERVSGFDAMLASLEGRYSSGKASFLTFTVAGARGATPRLYGPR